MNHYTRNNFTQGILTFCLCIIFFTSCKKDPVTFHPTNTVNPEFIHVANGKVVDTNGQPFTMKGVNLGGWLLWEAWEWGGGFNSETRMMNTIESRTSSSYAQSFRESIYNRYITRNDIAAISSMGLIRSGFHLTMRFSIMVLHQMS